MTKNKELGNFGEETAIKNLKKSGYNILEKNYYSQYGEIDIIATKGSILAFIEVKTRSENPLLSPREAVNLKKQERIKKTALIYMNDFKGDYFLRFDVIEIVLNNHRGISKYIHLEDVF